MPKKSATAAAAQTQGRAPASPAELPRTKKPKVGRKPAPAATPPGLADVQLLPIEACCAPGGVGTTWWRDAVAAGRAPQPVVRLPRCTRWRASDVKRFWAKFAEHGGLGPKGVA